MALDKSIKEVKQR